MGAPSPTLLSSSVAGFSESVLDRAKTRKTRNAIDLSRLACPPKVREQKQKLVTEDTEDTEKRYFLSVFRYPG